MERKLTAIMAADVVGYSRLMGADEAGTHAALKALRAEVVDPRMAEHHGRIVKLMGDGALVEFASGGRASATRTRRIAICVQGWHTMKSASGQE